MLVFFAVLMIYSLQLKEVASCFGMLTSRRKPAGRVVSDVWRQVEKRFPPNRVYVCVSVHMCVCGETDEERELTQPPLEVVLQGDRVHKEGHGVLAGACTSALQGSSVRPKPAADKSEAAAFAQTHTRKNRAVRQTLSLGLVCPPDRLHCHAGRFMRVRLCA